MILVCISNFLCGEDFLLHSSVLVFSQFCFPISGLSFDVQLIVGYVSSVLCVTLRLDSLSGCSCPLVCFDRRKLLQLLDIVLHM